jgi:hypothetical protein
VAAVLLSFLGLEPSEMQPVVDNSTLKLQKGQLSGLVVRSIQSYCILLISLIQES